MATLPLLPVRASAIAAAGAALFGMALAAGAARAQVLEIGDDGAVAVYAHPAVFTDAGATAIARPAPAAVRRGTRAVPADVARELDAAAQAYSLSPALVEAVARQESGLRHDAVSRAGAAGVMQLMPATARALGVDRFDLRQNIYGGTAYLSQLIGRFGGDLTLGLAAYNAGPAAVQRWGGTPPYAETRNYVAAILGRLADQAGPAVR